MFCLTIIKPEKTIYIYYCLTKTITAHSDLSLIRDIVDIKLQLILWNLLMYNLQISIICATYWNASKANYQLKWNLKLNLILFFSYQFSNVNLIIIPQGGGGTTENY